ncbi:MAG: PEP-utilizing enzyme [Candidatus Micrarchaeota archaeon]
MTEYERIWVDENAKYYDLEGALLNYGPRCEKKFGFGVKDAFIFGRGTHAELYIAKKEMTRVGVEGKAFFLSPDGLTRALNACKTAREEMTAQAQTIAKIDLRQLSNDALWKEFDFYGSKIGQIFTCYAATVPYAVAAIERELTFFLKIKNAEAAHALSVLTAPATKFVFSEEHPLFKPFNQTIEKEDATPDSRVAEKPAFREEEADETERTKLIAELAPHEEILRAAEVLRALAEERMKMRFAWLLGLYVNELFLAELKRRFGIPKTDLRKYAYAELQALMLSGQKLGAEKLQEREKGVAKILVGNEIDTIEGAKAQEFLDETIKPASQVKELVGVVASKGRAVGKVILLSYTNPAEHGEKISKMERGQVLVTQMTHPDMVVACKKAGAIVTDEGGMLSHAAIVSRELGIPCVVGTKVATSVLKDGELVEVNAFEGTVKKVG